MQPGSVRRISGEERGERRPVGVLGVLGGYASLSAAENSQSVAADGVLLTRETSCGPCGAPAVTMESVEALSRGRLPYRHVP